MNSYSSNISGHALHRIFDSQERSRIGEHYPEKPLTFQHRLESHPLLELESVAQFAERFPEAVEYNLADLPIAVSGKPQRPELTAAETVRQISEAKSWAVLRKIERDPAYRAMLDALLDEVAPEIEAKTGPMLHRSGFIFVTSASGVTPCHFDPEHNLLLQIRGSKEMRQYDVTDESIAASALHEQYHLGGPREVPWNENLETSGMTLSIGPGEGLFVPYMAPHFVRNGTEPSVSLSITWRSAWSYEEAEARGFNSLARRAGMSPKAPLRWPHRNRAKALGWKVYRRLMR